MYIYINLYIHILYVCMHACKIYVRLETLLFFSVFFYIYVCDQLTDINLVRFYFGKSIFHFYF